MTRIHFVRTAVLSGIVGLACCSTALAQDITLNVQDSMSSPNSEVFDQVYSECAAQVGVKVNAVRVPGNASMIGKILQQTATRTLPDVMMLDNPDVKQIAEAGSLAPIDDLGITGEGFLQGAIDAGSYEGHLYALPPVMNTLALFYNTDMLEAAGVEPPKTWDELRTAAAKLTKEGTYGIAFAAPASLEGTWQFLPFMWSNGGDETDIDTPETAEALQLWTDLVSSGDASKSVVTWGQGDVITQFASGAAAMMINGPWSFRALDKNPDIHWKTIQIPTPDGSRPIVPMGGQTLNVPQTGNQEKMQKAADFVACVISEDKEVLFAKGQVGVPALPAAAERAAEIDPRLKPFVGINQGARARTGKLGVAWPETAAKIYQAIQLALTGQATPEEALKMVK
jgi:multiple sugar transport system substrate-binding protein